MDGTFLWRIKSRDGIWGWGKKVEMYEVATEKLCTDKHDKKNQMKKKCLLAYIG